MKMEPTPRALGQSTESLTVLTKMVRFSIGNTRNLVINGTISINTAKLANIQENLLQVGLEIGITFPTESLQKAYKKLVE